MDDREIVNEFAQVFAVAHARKLTSEHVSTRIRPTQIGGSSRPIRPRVSRATRYSRVRGKWFMPNTVTLYFQLGMLTYLPLRRSSRASTATSSASSHNHSGVLDMSMPAR